MMKKIVFVVFVLCASLETLPCWAQQAWNFKQTYESKTLINSPFFLFTSADINNNKTKELIVTDFGQFGDHIEEWKQWKEIPTRFYNLYVLEWESGELRIRLHKKWDMKIPKTRDERDEYFRAFDARQMISWKIGDRVIVETIPPYLGIEWQDGIYHIHEQQGWAQKTPLVGSWVFPWLSSSCYQSFPNKPTWPRECVVGVRDFAGKGELKIVTILEEEIVNNKIYKQTLRVRKFETGFPVEWEESSPKRFNWWLKWSIVDPSDRLNLKSKSPLLMTVFKESSWYLIEPDKKGQKYKLRQTGLQGPMSIKTYDLPDVYLRATQKKDVEEFWGYRRVELNDPDSINFIVMLRKVAIKPDLSDFIKEDIDFPRHDHFLGIGYFIVEDVDGDGLDEIILVEETAGKLTFGEETVHYGDIKDYIHIMKWDGAKYKTMWVSPPYTKRGTKFLVDDIKNTGKMQLVVLTPYGTVQIWER